MVTIGLTGGYATGKTKVAEMFKKFGAEVVSADKIAHRLILPRTHVWAKIVKYFGEEILGSRSRINRKKLGAIVFSSKKLLRKLNSFVHPEVKKEIKNIIKCNKEKKRKNIIIFETPLLFEAGMKNWFDKIIVVMCNKDVQYKRALLRDKINKTEFTDRFKSQWPQGKKIKYADFIVNNNKEVLETKKQVKTIWEKLEKEG
jgi:dephospho-CoA kinase